MRNYRYSDELAHKICMLLEIDKTPQEIQFILGDQLPKDDPDFNATCTRIRNKHAYKHISQFYNIKPLYVTFEESFIDSVCGLLELGKSNSEIAATLGIPMDTRLSSLCANLRRHNPIYQKYLDRHPNIQLVTRNSSEITLDQIEQIMQLKSQGYNITQIAEILGPTNPNINRTKLYSLMSRIKSDPNARGRDIALKYGVIK